MRALVVLIATAGGIGYAPVAPGTFGSLLAVPLMPAFAALRDAWLPCYLAALAAIVAVATWAAGRAEAIFGRKDHSRIVVDEVAGQLVAGAFIPATWPAIAIAFAFFRLFDVLKPWPARTFDRDVRGGIGVVGDDLIAGAYAGVATRGVLWLLGRTA